MSTTFRNLTADSNLVRLVILPEDIWGEYVTNVLPVEARITGESLSLDRGTILTEEIRSDRNLTDLVATKESASGGFEFEFSALSYDEIISSAMFSPWVEVGSTPRGSTGVEVVVMVLEDAAGERITDRAVMEFKTPQNTAVPTFNLEVGQVFRLTSSNTGQGDRFAGNFQVVSHQANPSTARTDRDGNALADPQFYSRYIVRKVRAPNEENFVEDFPAPAAAGDEDDFYNDVQQSGGGNFEGPLDYSLNSRYVKNGSQKCSVQIEKTFEDTKDRIAYNGLVVSTFTLSAEAEAKVVGSVDFSGRGGDVTEAVVDADGVRYFGQRRVGSPADNELDDMNMPILGTQHQADGVDRTGVNAVEFGDVIPATSTEIVNAGRNISSIKLYRKNPDGTDGPEIDNTSTLVMSLSTTLDNSTREKLALGDKQLIDVGIGNFSCSGDISIYFASGAMYDIFRGDRSFALNFSLGDDAGNLYNLYYPNVKWTQTSPNASAQNTDIMLEGSWQALKDRGARGDVTAGGNILGSGATLVISQITG